MKDVMIDIETMGTRPDAAIVALGAVEFDLEAGAIGQSFYRAVNLATAVARGGTMDPGTVMFWLGQPDESRNAIRFSAGHVDTVLAEFVAFVASCAPSDVVRPWGNSASFDVTTLETAMRHSGIEAPWKFWNQRCFRTVRAMFPTVEAPERGGVHHNAVDDAMFQVQHLLKMKAERGAK